MAVVQQVGDTGGGGGPIAGQRVATRTERVATRRGVRVRHLPGGPRWRALLEARWQDRLQKVTELSLAFHDAGAAAPRHSAEQLRRLMRRATAARRDLADTDDALRRLAGGRFGQCERCTEPIPAAQLLRVPEGRYCPHCA
jgi:RNA polymerase-binding transcription factor DksA